jgi:hypothetical protein
MSDHDAIELPIVVTSADIPHLSDYDWVVTAAIRSQFHRMKFGNHANIDDADDFFQPGLTSDKFRELQERADPTKPTFSWPFTNGLYPANHLSRYPPMVKRFFKNVVRVYISPGHVVDGIYVVRAQPGEQDTELIGSAIVDQVKRLLSPFVLFMVLLPRKKMIWYGYEMIDENA